MANDLTDDLVKATGSRWMQAVLDPTETLDISMSYSSDIILIWWWCFIVRNVKRVLCGLYYYLIGSATYIYSTIASTRAKSTKKSINEKIGIMPALAPSEVGTIWCLWHIKTTQKKRYFFVYSRWTLVPTLPKNHNLKRQGACMVLAE